MVDIGENMVDQPHHDVISEEVSSEENESVDENDIARYESRQQERMKEEMVDIGEDMAEKPHHDVISEEVSSDDNESDVDENEIANSTARYESRQQERMKEEMVDIGEDIPVFSVILKEHNNLI